VHTEQVLAPLHAEQVLALVDADKVLAPGHVVQVLAPAESRAVLGFRTHNPSSCWSQCTLSVYLHQHG